MKIGFFLPNATFDLPGTREVGGIETFTFAVGEAMQRLGHEVVLYGGRPKEGRTHRPTTMRVELFDYIERHDIPDFGRRFRRLVQRVHFGWACRKAWLAERFDVALLAKPFDWPVAWAWKRRQPRLTVVMGFQGGDFFPGDRRFYSAVDRGFAVSSTVADIAEKRLGRRPAVIHNPTDTQFFCPSDHDTGDPAGPFVLVSSGRLVGWKGFDRLVTAIAAVRRSGHDLVCRIAGDGPQRDRLEQAIRKESLEGTMVLRGRLDRGPLRDFLRGADAFVAPSINLDAFPVATVEAVSTGLPLLLSDQVGTREALTAKDYIEYSARDLHALTSGIIALISRRKEPDWTDRAARHERVRRVFDQEVVAAQILALV